VALLASWRLGLLAVPAAILRLTQSVEAGAMQFDGQVDFLYPDGTHAVVTVHAGQRGGRWTGSVRLPQNERRLERGDVCRLTHARFNGELRIVITDLTGTARYAFIGLIKPDPWETL